MASLNQVQLIGNLGQDPEIRFTQDGKPIASFSIATSESWKDKQGNKQEKTEWHRLVSFSEGLNKNVIEPYVRKGTKIFVEGKLVTRKWQDKEGADRYTTEVVLDGFNSKLILLGGDAEKTPLQGNQQQGGQASDEAPFDMDDSDNIPGFD